MKKIFKSTVLGMAVAATTLAAVPAEAHDHWRRHHHRSDSGNALAAGIAGLAIGTIVGGALSQPSGRVYIDRPPQRYYRPAPVYRAPTYRAPVTYYRSYEPWTREWYRACDARYRSFDPASGTFLGYDGQRHFCVIR
ncbi:BA14K family protein [Chelativorans sp. YIM 93263]|uniref:BA14K family protein n=1 Tax=Chelativorans sp. YIM 93263 TaxID=2906648 RepID=UPI0023789293|nr:BA14K family protein [Chelativorans sp. YIM 93263]